MPTKKTSRKKTTVRQSPIETVRATTTSQESSTTSKFLLPWLLLLSLAFVVMFWKMQNLENLLKQGAGGAAANQQANAEYLSVDSMKKYAKEMGLDTTKFNKCLDSGEKKAIVDAETKQGSDLGVKGTPGFFVNGRFFGGAFPFEVFKEVIDKELAGKGSSECKDYSEDLQKYCDETGNNGFNPVPKTIDLTNVSTPAKGAQNAKVVIVEYSDFQCPFCQRAYPTVVKIMKEYPNDVKIYYKQFPLNQIHPRAEKAAEASLCAGDQGKFWEFHNKLFEVSGATGE